MCPVCSSHFRAQLTCSPFPVQQFIQEIFQHWIASKFSYLSPHFTIKLLKSMPSLLHRPKIFQQCNVVFFNSTSLVRCRRIPDLWQLRFILKFSFVSQYPNIFLCNLELSSYKQTPVWYLSSYLQSFGKPSLLLDITHDQVLQLQNKHRQKVHSLPFCLITYHHNCAQCTAADYCYMCSMLFPIKYYMD